MEVDVAKQDEKKWHVSFNAHLINKTPPKDKKYFAEGFEIFKVSMDDYIEVISKGFAFSYVYHDDVRKGVNFAFTDCLCVDVDGGFSLTEAEEHPFVKAHASFIYTTASHTPDHHKFRIVFLLDESLEDPDHLRYATRALAKMLGGDIAVSDPGRLFYGNSDARVIRFDQTIDEETLASLIDDGRAITVEKRRAAFVGTASAKFTDQTVFVTREGEQVTAEQVKSKTVVKCPFHLDKTASSFLGVNDHGDVYHYCSVCCVTRWQPNSTHEQFLAQDDFVDVMREIERHPEIKRYDTPLKGLEKFQKDPEEGSPSVKFTTERYLPDLGLGNGFIFVRSPKGSGKTEFVKREVARLKARYQSFEDFEEASWDGDDRLYSDTRILLLGHRQALIGEMCSRVGLHSYLDDSGLSDGELIEKRKRYGICVDSALKIRNEKYDVIIIDEVQQVLAHFLSETLRGKRIQIWNAFCSLIKSAKKVVVLDADLSWSSFHTLINLKPEKVNAYVRINEWLSSDNKTIDVYSSRDHLIQQISTFAAEGKRLFVTANSKKLILRIAEMLGGVKKSDGSGVRVFYVTSENSKSSEAQEFIKNVKQELLSYDVILASPSLGTGVDISFEKGAQLVDHVVGLFVGGVTDHKDIDQQLLRVRNPKQVSVWIDPAPDFLETDFDAVLEDLKTRHLDLLLEGESVGVVVDDLDHQFIAMVARIVRDKNISLNYLKLNFLKYKEAQGWIANYVGSDKANAALGRKGVKQAAKRLQEKRVAAIYNASTLSLYDYLRVDDRINKLQLPVSDHLRDSYYKTRLELFYRCDLTEELIEQDMVDNLRAQLSLYRNLTNNKFIDELFEADLDFSNSIKLNLIPENMHKVYVIAQLLMKTPIYDKGFFRSDIEITQNDLKGFSAEAVKLTHALRSHVGVKVRADVKSKPMQLLGKLLKLTGLELVKARSSGKTGVKVYFYQLDGNKKQFVDELLSPLTDEAELALAEAYPDMADRYSIGWCYLTDKYGVKFTPGQHRWMFPGLDSNGEFISRSVLQGHEKWAASVGLR